MIVVIGTNTVLQAMSRRSLLRPLLAAWFSGKLSWAVSTEILFEYQEIVTLRSGPARWAELAGMFDMVRALRPETLPYASPSFRFHLIPGDPDDNKFADCAIVAGAEWIITEDRDFDVLAARGQPPQPITPREFIQRFLSGA